MWSYKNPVRILFGTDRFATIASLIGNRAYALVTYPDAPFQTLTARLEAEAGKPLLVVSDIAPNPDYRLLATQCERFLSLCAQPEVIVALGGGSVIDSAKVFASAAGDFSKVRRHLETGDGASELSSIPVIAVPTTAGTGSEVTCWATVWDEEKGRKYSLAREALYPETAVVDPALMLGKPYGLTLATGLDALSHSIESIWNVNANPVSARHAVAAASAILVDLPALLRDLGNLDLRSRIAEASLNAGLAFSNTKTAIAHNLSYPITLGWGVQHGIACSFTLPTVLRSVVGIGGFREAALKQIFGDDLRKGADDLDEFLASLGVGNRFSDHGVPDTACRTIIDEAFAGERGKNFIGSKESFLEAATQTGVLKLSPA
ncbi:iron-containing alcohol dehydrogenase PsrA [Roseovarius aestuarii]|uniref:NAD-dependent methanol dehydrogenase n=1 Tax=Roseovarius aestuarii TaxID=475083 RepID=A0A1X7BPL7_9RHOB|nr:iron-containing alcohol dehydrogenase PsrA [Roseovarius aestuarii]SMC11588.1 NAD-dependent methanol dehydrogenase [Roseovarius aestuarii]